MTAARKHDLVWIGAALIALAFALLSCSCSTVTPLDNIGHYGSFDEQPIKVSGGYNVPEWVVDEYDALVDVYGHSKLLNGAPIFVPALDRGKLPYLGEKWWYMTNQDYSNLIVLRRMKGRGQKP